jgi:hypothetical protein
MVWTFLFWYRPTIRLEILVKEEEKTAAFPKNFDMTPP